VTNPPPPRTAQERLRDTLARLESDIDAWVATAAESGGTPYLVPLSFLWDGETLLLSTPTDSPTGRNLRATGEVRLGLGLTRDVVLVEGSADATPATEIADSVAEAFAAKCGFDPRDARSRYSYFRVRPRRVQAWREVDELAGRELMRDGGWIVPQG
jgi:hypothetical protein